MQEPPGIIFLKKMSRQIILLGILHISSMTLYLFLQEGWFVPLFGLVTGVGTYIYSSRLINAAIKRDWLREARNETYNTGTLYIWDKKPGIK